MPSRKSIAAVALFLALVLAALLLLDGIDAKTDRQETEAVRRAVRNAAMTCFVVEGAYAPDLQYLKDHYGLSYNADRYIVTYDAFASNLMPEINVLVKGGGGA